MLLYLVLPRLVINTILKDGYQLFFPIMHVYSVLSAKYVNCPWYADKID